MRSVSSPTPWWVTPWAAPWRWRWRPRAPGRSPASWRSRRWAPPARRLSAELDAIWAAPAGPTGARDMLSRLVLDQALVTETAVEARAAAMRAGAAAFASMFPPPRARWADDLTLSAQTLADGPRTRAARPRRRGPRHPARGRRPCPCSNTWPMSVCTCSGDAGTCRRSSTRTTSGACCRASSPRAEDSALAAGNQASDCGPRRPFGPGARRGGSRRRTAPRHGTSLQSAHLEFVARED